jgi:hypothetical protein
LLLSDGVNLQAACQLLVPASPAFEEPRASLVACCRRLGSTPLVQIDQQCLLRWFLEMT